MKTNPNSPMPSRTESTNINASIEEDLQYLSVVRLLRNGARFEMPLPQWYALVACVNSLASGLRLGSVTISDDGTVLIVPPSLKP